MTPASRLFLLKGLNTMPSGERCAAGRVHGYSLRKTLITGIEYHEKLSDALDIHTGIGGPGVGLLFALPTPAADKKPNIVLI